MSMAWAGLGASPALAAPPPGAAQEIALAGLAIGTQTVHGPHGLAEPFYPPPGAPLAPSGSFVRVFFSYSPQAGAGSTMAVAFDGRSLGTVQLTSSLATGGVDEFPIPPELIDTQHQNRLQVRFELRAPAVAAADQEALYGRVDNRTLVHYHLAVPLAGVPSLETYPYSLLATDATQPATPRLAVALPAAPDLTEVGAALTVLADLGRRAATQRVEARVISLDQLPAPGTQGAAIVLVGRLDRLSAATRVLEEAGWRPDAQGWIAPDGHVARLDDGIAMTSVSPWDHRTPVMLVTGATTQALAQAAAAVGGPPSASLAGRSTDLTGPPADDLTLSGAAQTVQADLSFTAPAAASGGSGNVVVHVPAFGPTQTQGSVQLAVNGSPVGSAQLDQQGLNTTTVQGSVPGHLLHAGLNSLTVSLRIPPGTGVTSSDGTPVTASLRLPPPPGDQSGLEALPFPFFGPPGQAARMVLTDLTQSTLTAAVQAAIALGHRAAEPAGRLVTVLADDSSVAGRDNLIVVGRPASGGALDELFRAAPRLQQPPGPSDGLLEETHSGGRTVLLVSGPGAAALYDPQLAGQVALVDSAGRVSYPALSDGPGGGPRPSGPLTSRGAGLVGMLILGAALVLLGAVVIQLLHTRRHST
jgi:hypothetical protein